MNQECVKDDLATNPILLLTLKIQSIGNSGNLSRELVSEFFKLFR